MIPDRSEHAAAGPPDGELDFRRPADVKELEAALAKIDPATLG